jgi:hypothetical protein
MYGKISLDVGYDKARDIFIGVEEPETLKAAKAAFADVKIERLKAGGHPALLIQMRQRQTNKTMYALYIALGIETNTVYIALRPPNNSSEVGQFIWETLKKNLVAGP